MKREGRQRVLGMAHWLWLWVGVRALPPSHCWEVGTDLGLRPSAKGHGHHSRDPCDAPGTVAPPAHLRGTRSSAGAQGVPPGLILQWELRAAPEQPVLAPGGLSPCRRPPCPLSWQYHRPTPPAQGTPALRATCKPESHLCTTASSSLTMAASLRAFEGTPVSPICTGRHFCTWESKKNLFLGVGEARTPQAGSTVPPSSLCCLRHPCSPRAWAWGRAG